jgi:hypothetical protein
LVAVLEDGRRGQASEDQEVEVEEEGGEVKGWKEKSGGSDWMTSWLTDTVWTRASPK